MIGYWTVDEDDDEDDDCVLLTCGIPMYFLILRLPAERGRAVRLVRLRVVWVGKDEKRKEGEIGGS